MVDAGHYLMTSEGIVGVRGRLNTIPRDVIVGVLGDVEARPGCLPRSSHAAGRVCEALTLASLDYGFDNRVHHERPPLTGSPGARSRQAWWERIMCNSVCARLGGSPEVVLDAAPHRVVAREGAAEHLSAGQCDKAQPHLLRAGHVCGRCATSGMISGSGVNLAPAVDASSAMASRRGAWRSASHLRR
jgi:hypothetical protein